MNNQLCKEPGAGKLHAGFCRGISLARGLSTQPQLEILNLAEFNKEVERVSESRQWDDFNTVLEFCLTQEGKEYQGEVIFIDGKNNFKLNMDENCPVKLEFRGVDYNLRVNYEVFLFEVLSKK